MTRPSPHRQHWQLNPEVAFLNHGSFGATPSVVLNVQREFQDALERDPIHFLAPERDLEPKLDQARNRIASLVGAGASDLAFVRTATDGVNAVLRSFPLDTDDEIVVTNHGYNACNNAVAYAAKRASAVVRIAQVPFPIQHPDEVVGAIKNVLTNRTRLLVVDHVTSPTGLVFPIEKIIDMARSRGIRVLVDGAHAPGMLSIDLNKIAADYYTANHHKWLCGPKVSGFLWVREDLQHEVRPNVISHGANRSRPNRSRFLTEFDWMGTFDPTPILSMCAAIEFLSNLLPGGYSELLATNRELALKARKLLCDARAIDPPAPTEMIGTLVSVPLSIQDETKAESLKSLLFDQHQIEVPIFPSVSGDGYLLRTSSFVYNDLSEYERLAMLIFDYVRE